MPSFCVDFSAVPLCFKFLHSELLLKSMVRSCTFVYNPVSIPIDVEDEVDFAESHIELQISCDYFKREPTEIGTVMPDVIEIKDNLSLHASVKGPILSGQNGKHKNIKHKGTQRRRTSHRLKKARSASLVDRSNGALAYSLRSGQKRRSVPCVGSNKKLRSSVNSCTAVSSLEASSAMVDSREGHNSSHCSANILIKESDRCHRVEGAVVTLEKPASNDWHFAVKKDGITKGTFKAEKVMRPCSCNRYTHVIMFSLDNGWKLEFPNRRDWVVFKDLYKECSDHSIPATVPKLIPVPGVHDVSDYAYSGSVSFERPDAYISANGDELSRAMTRKTANYDMDSEDEDWRSKFNNEFQEHVSEDNFELIVNALEKAYFFNSGDFYDEKYAAIQCKEFGSKEVVEAVYSYWMRKREQKRSSLLRVFQSYQAKRLPLIPQPLLRKKRSFKRQPSQLGRGKHPSALQAIASEQEALEEKNTLLKIEKAKASAKEAKEFALQKRKRAQTLMENADLAVYKATMLVKIAEVAQAGESVDAFATYFLH
ncbi:putative enhancer of polycomb protein [Lupinus albus]|uniref:Enhancer of polycomb-like protein n=1 Tax=Lupinus albus TaxID=3870 RepID=A0A6A4QZT8_LUPAL|nr:putative enhancer of polycomb protein [Lupinus albus]